MAPKNHVRLVAALDAVERIDGKSAVVALVVRGEAAASATTFVTAPEAPLQLGLFVYPKAGEVPRHTHRPLERHLTGTADVLVVRSGRCEVDLYDDDRRFITSRAASRSPTAQSHCSSASQRSSSSRGTR